METKSKYAAQEAYRARHKLRPVVQLVLSDSMIADEPDLLELEAWLRAQKTARGGMSRTIWAALRAYKKQQEGG